MIFVCEIQCKDISHAKVNSGFIYGLHLAYPHKKILFYSHKSHIKEIRGILSTSKIKIKKLTHVPIYFDADKAFSLSGLAKNYLLIRKIFNQALSNNICTILFLSTSPIILFIIKVLKLQTRYKDICCTSVLHGELEDIANSTYQEPYTPNPPSNNTTASYGNFRIRIYRKIDKMRVYLTQVVGYPSRQLSSQYSLIFKRIFRTKKMMTWRHSNQYKYISLSPHVTENANKHINTDYLNFQTIIMPILFNVPTPIPNNNYIKFAVFGYGDSAMMHKMLVQLSKMKVKNRYEIRIISMDSRGTEGYPNVTCMSNGKAINRAVMENAAKDIDVFINLYDQTRHSLGCSLSIFEALSLLKPVLHLSNPGYNYFNKRKKPIGYRTENINDFVNKMTDMIEHYKSYQLAFGKFRSNMLEYREVYNIKNNLIKLEHALTYH